MMILKRPSAAVARALEAGDAATIFGGDCMDLLKALPDGSIPLTISSPPYCMGKAYETGNNVEDFVAAHERILPELFRITRPGGSLCWQVGYHVRDGELTPLDYLVLDAMRRHCKDMVLRNRIIWTFGHGRHASNRFSGRHEMILWFTKGESHQFDLDSVRIPQKYPGKRANRGPRKGEFSGNPLGKNPSDVWDVPNVKAKHVEKTEHPCQFPVAIPQRLIRALSRQGDLVLDPFAGVASTGVAAVLENRRFLGAELRRDYCDIGRGRIAEALGGDARVRPMNQEIHVPSPSSSVARRPGHFWVGSAASDNLLAAATLAE